MICVMGVAGAGKTTIGQLLAAELVLKLFVSFASTNIARFATLIGQARKPKGLLSR
jgi:adenylate kinase family enzyme